MGKLEATGQATRAGFKVKEGRHVVRVLHPEIPAEDIEVNLRTGQKARVLLDLIERYEPDTGKMSRAIAGQ